MNSISSKWTGHLAVLAVNIIFGFNSPTSKLIVPEWISPQLFTCVRLTFATLMFWIVGAFFPREHVTLKDKATIFVGGVFGLVVVMYSFAEALRYTSPINITLIAALTPIIVMLLAAIFLKEPITLKKAGGVLLGFMGVLTLIMPQITAEGLSSLSLKGDLLCFANITAYAIYLISTRKVTQKYSTITLMKWMFLFSWICSLPLCIGQDFSAIPMFSSGIAWKPLLQLSYIVIFATGIAYFLTPLGLKRLRPTTVSMYSNLQPIIASCITIALGQDHFSRDKLHATLFVILGVALVTRSKARDEITPKTPETQNNGQPNSQKTENQKI